MSTDFIEKRPDVAKRFAAAWAKAIEYINKDPAAARKYLAKNTMTPDNVVDTVPMLGYIMTKDMSPKQLDYLQKFADFGALGFAQGGVVFCEIAEFARDDGPAVLQEHRLDPVPFRQHIRAARGVGPNVPMLALFGRTDVPVRREFHFPPELVWNVLPDFEEGRKKGELGRWILHQLLSSGR